MSRTARINEVHETATYARKKTLYRSAVRTVLTFILLGAVTFAFFMQIAEHSITARELENAAGQYFGSGTVEIEPPGAQWPLRYYADASDGDYTHAYHPLTKAQTDMVSALPYITSTDTRFMTSGLSDEYKRLYEGDEFNDFAMCIVEGTLEHHNAETSVLILTDSVVLAGNPRTDEIWDFFWVHYFPDTIPNNEYDREYMQKNMVVGNRYAFVMPYSVKYVSAAFAFYVAGGFDSSCLSAPGEVIILGRGLADKHGAAPGDIVVITPEGAIENIPLFSKDMLKNSIYPGLSDEEILEQHMPFFLEQAEQHSNAFTVAGVMSTPSGKYDNTAFLPGSDTANMLYAAQSRLDVAEFTLADNMRADEFREFCERFEKRIITLVMDTSKLENPKNMLRILETLYPIITAAALLIGAFLCSLAILQSSKEAAIMRVFGTTRAKTRTILTLEQALLSIMGVTAGCCGLLILKGQALAEVSKELCIYSAMYLAVIIAAATVCSTLATHRSVLELLQTKE